MAARTTTARAPSPLPRTLGLGFLAGVLSVLVVHQGTVFLLHQAGVIPNGPFRTVPIPPFGVPQIVNQAFWGGLWGVVIAWLLTRTTAPALLFGAAFGCVALSLTNFVVLPAIKGGAYFAGGVPARIWPVLLITAAFGWGVALFLRLLARRA